MSKIKPFGCRVVVKRIEIPEKIGTFYVPDTVKDKEKPRIGEVIALSKESEKAFTLGQRVIFGKYAGVDVEQGNETVTILKMEDIHGIDE